MKLIKSLLKFILYRLVIKKKVQFRQSFSLRSRNQSKILFITSHGRLNLEIYCHGKYLKGIYDCDNYQFVLLTLLDNGLYIYRILYEL